MSKEMPEHPFPAIAESATVRLRRLRPTDRIRFQAYRKHPSVTQFQSWPDMSKVEMDGFLWAMSQLETPLQPGKWTQIAIARPGPDTLVGDMGWHLSDSMSEVELGVTIDPMHQRKGYAEAAMRMAMAVVFSRPQVNAVICGADPRNTASLSLIRKIGFTFTHLDPSPMEEGILDEMFAMTRTTFDAH